VYAFATPAWSFGRLAASYVVVTAAPPPVVTLVRLGTLSQPYVVVVAAGDVEPVRRSSGS